MKNQLVVIFLLIVLGCGNSKKQVADGREKEYADFKEEGFEAALIIYDELAEEPCDYLIQVEDKRLLEPLTLDKEFKQSGLRIWIKYTPQRRQSRCKDVVPVEIHDIKKERNY